jgi:hypothetical protein
MGMATNKQKTGCKLLVPLVKQKRVHMYLVPTADFIRIAWRLGHLQESGALGSSQPNNGVPWRAAGPSHLGKCTIV